MREGRRDILPASCAPYGLSRIESAAFVNVSPSTFDRLVKEGRMPKPKRIYGRKVWHRLGLERAFDALPGEDDKNPWDELQNQ